MSLASVSIRHTRSLLHWKVDPEIFPLVGVVSGVGVMGIYTLNRKREQLQNDVNLHPISFTKDKANKHKASFAFLEMFSPHQKNPFLPMKAI
ncbi:hypothetical protein DSO57_1027414 [Entomophthora muscae]|uniref:Uncharacterized protein n=1 Tax=Entomophthora muscae TaxID=34485 RepID=A0ACC2SQS6_9FUNG|nr:hypothetical protein DSO57_1027414 [Entomophthora muscae]